MNHDFRIEKVFEDGGQLRIVIQADLTLQAFRTADHIVSRQKVRWERVEYLT